MTVDRLLKAIARHDLRGDVPRPARVPPGDVSPIVHSPRGSHSEVIVVPAAAEQVVAERRFMDEAEPLVHLAGPVVDLVHVEPDPLRRSSPNPKSSSAAAASQP